ncbi:hypothetical protein GMOD_00003033 [Pyrenophora seminiperda CCB06]|uniref:Uncharacterized protein n=1 Tax=Pyrenophora seminiperda CCB06 TaxID=1302712 RepID=A0A3M7M3Z5_9PLEO|nr:hypothetical protein GMOD_00003033 [Pyrenophora seminiperda CCB06]
MWLSLRPGNLLYLHALPDHLAASLKYWAYLAAMPGQADQDLLLCLQSSLRNALATFGVDSKQYRDIKLVVDEYMAKLAMEGLSISSESRREVGEEGEERVCGNMQVD